MDTPQELIDELIDASVKYGEAIEIGDSNQTIIQRATIYKIRESVNGSEYIEELKKLLDHSNDYVRYKTAFSLLPFEPDKARETITELFNKSEFWNIGRK
ncbi:hypothetical protein [Chengkuizengella axinellae]|uniref:HEAT repeat domain-containing protein n=1 Tax=Chengkuizengella axinellae TaxID=3064388 RepID=A0ABT9IWW7_9BACL|nr:hypothetical protein [Chengkuizengella sp. 2205SS18-9]MDP5273847.1 hypothetical protein [Chengkuizengella sp. 2205SS18-9]